MIRCNVYVGNPDSFLDLAVLTQHIERDTGQGIKDGVKIIVDERLTFPLAVITDYPEPLLS